MSSMKKKYEICWQPRPLALLRALGSPAWWQMLASGPLTLLALELGASTTEAPEEGVKTFFEPVDREREVLENP